MAAGLLFTSCFKNMNKKTTIKDHTIVFYNVENLFDTIDAKGVNDEDFTPEGRNKWDSKRYNKKLENISWVLANINTKQLPSLVGLSEIENKQVIIDLIKVENLKGNNYKIIHEDSPDERGIDVCLIYNPDFFKYTSHKSIPVTIPDEPDFKGRDILYAKGEIKGEVFHVFVNHWKSRRGGQKATEYKRIQAAKILRKYVDDIFSEDKNANIVIVGDFNDEPTSKTIQETLFATNNIKNPKPYELFNLMYEFDLKKMGTNTYNHEWFMLDNMIVSQNLVSGKGKFYVNPDSGKIFNNPKIVYYNSKAGFSTPDKTYGGKQYFGGYSDHLPVYFTLSEK